MTTKNPLRGRPKSFYSKTAQNKIQSLDRALDVLDILASRGEMTLSEVADALSQSPATIYRVLSTLDARGVVESDPNSQSWAIGPMAFQLGSAFLRRSSVVERSRPVMRELMSDTGETANLGVETGGNVMFLSQVETHETIRAFFPPGTQSPMHASGIGKALMAHMPERRLKRVLKAAPMQRYTDNTIIDTDKLLDELALIRRQGYAFDNEEKSSGMRCIAAPVMNFFGEAVAGISVSGPSHRITLADVESVSSLVKQAAEGLSRGLGAPEG